MSSANQYSILRKACPLGGIFVTLVTLVTCVIIVKVNDIWVSGLAWPFLSDMGRDAPAYYVFCVGLTLVAMLLIVTWTFNWHYHKAVLPKEATVFRGISLITASAGVIATLGLPVLAFFDTSTYAELHSAGAKWFFYIETIAVFLNTIISYKLYIKLVGMQTDLENGFSTMKVKIGRKKKTLMIQAIFFMLFFLSFLIYMPIGLAVAPQSYRLSIDDCIDKGLGEEYCGVKMRLNSTSTTLYDTKNTHAASQMRAAAQLACILTLIGYSTSFVTNDYNDSEEHDLTEHQDYLAT